MSNEQGSNRIKFPRLVSRQVQRRVARKLALQVGSDQQPGLDRTERRKLANAVSRTWLVEGIETVGQTGDDGNHQPG